MSDFQELVGGYLIDQEDRDQLAATQTDANLLMMGDIPAKMDPRQHPEAGKGFLKVENQGSIGSCQGNALTENAEFCYMLATGLIIHLSRMFAYLVSQMHDNINGDRGSTLSGGTRCVEQDGICREEIAPYPGGYPGHRWVTAGMKEDARKYKLKTHTKINSAEHAKQYLGSGVGIIQIGISWGRDMNPDSSGCIRSFSGSGGGGHSVCFVGYVPDSEVGQSSSKGYWFLLKNSWGERWGDRGYAYVDPQAIDQMLRHRFSVFYGRSDMDTPSPRPLPVDFTKPGQSRYA